MISSPRSLILCALMLLIFGALSYTAAITKNSTYDETLHVPAAWANLHGDFRANPEHPPLWKYWCALPHLIWPIKSGGSDDWGGIRENFAYEWNWAVEVLYHTPGNDADAIVNHARFMMMLVAMGLGAMLMAWAWQLAGVTAAIVAGTLYCFDPNFLAHGSLVTNDVAMSLCFFAWIWALWKVGQEASARRILLLAAACGIAIMVKFSGLLLGPMTLAMLLIRATGGSWRILGETIDKPIRRMAAALAICIVVAGVSYVIIWAGYLFRYSAIPGGHETLAWQAGIAKTEFNELYSKHPGKDVLPAERANWQPSLLARSLIFCNKHHLLPEAFCFGVIFVHTSGLVRSAYLLGQISPVGWWYYFPLAILFKTPTATIAASAIAVVIACRKFSTWRRNAEKWWLAVTLFVPPMIYLLFIMGENLDLGLRHVLEIYPPIYLGIGLVAAQMARWERWKAQLLTGILAVLLVSESVTAWPNYIPFFNWPSGGWRGGIKLLGDSNLDWGQDLKLLGQWQKTHRDQKLYLLYFGTADPAYYGIQYSNLPGSYILGPSMALPTSPGIIAASATDMQGIYLDDAEHHAYSWMLRAKPITVLGGSIYLFEYPYHGE
jgi:Dolichyl-phosphate-mannose-protein mannosyltransferase